MTAMTFPAQPGTLGVHSTWNADHSPEPAVMVETYDADNGVFVEARNAQGYTFVKLSSTQARALGVALIAAAALQEYGP